MGNKNITDKRIEILNDVNDEITNRITSIPEFVLDELNYTMQYCYTALSINESPFNKKSMIGERYAKSQTLFENDLNLAPHIIKRLETFVEKLAEDSLTSRFAQKYLPHVKNFYDMLKEYGDLNKK